MFIYDFNVRLNMETLDQVHIILVQILYMLNNILRNVRYEDVKTFLILNFVKEF